MPALYTTLKILDLYDLQDFKMEILWDEFLIGAVNGIIIEALVTL